MRALNPTQTETFDELLQIGAERPTSPPGLVAEIKTYIEKETTPKIIQWTEPSFWLSKSQMQSALQCEDKFKDEADSIFNGMHPATAVGIIAHKAIQVAHTHPGKNIMEYVQAAVVSSYKTGKNFCEFWDSCDIAEHSDYLTQATSKVAGFLDSWPPLDSAWTPRFEEPIQTKIGKLTLACRADLIIGRPKASGRQTILLTDLKTGAIKDHHHDEATFYALVAALRLGILPWRSCIYSLASGTYTEPDVDSARLWEGAEMVVKAVGTIVDVMTERRDVTATTGDWCNWCVKKDACVSYAKSKEMNVAVEPQY